MHFAVAIVHLDEFMAATLQLRLLGTPEIDLDRTPVGESLPGKAQAALYYLAVTGQPQTRSALAGLLWGDLPEAAARSNLRKILANLRQVAGPTSTSIAIRPPSKGIATPGSTL